MPYAANGLISQDEIENSIEITEGEYNYLLLGVLDGKIIQIVNNEAVLVDSITEPVSASDNIRNTPEGLFGGPNLKEIFNGN